MMLTFKRDVQKRRMFFTPESFAHPAKLDLGLLLWIVGKYTKPGDIILDPMAGSGSTMLATRYGRNVVVVELEEKFVKMAEDNWSKLVFLPKLKWGLGDCRILQGDARNLTDLLVDHCIFSPPYASEQIDNRKTLNKTILNHKGMGQAYREGYNTDNIANLPYGEISSIITSPPYENAIARGDAGPLAHASHDPNFKDKRQGYSGNVDSIITSPPYEGSLAGSDKSGNYNDPTFVEKLSNLPSGNYSTPGRLRALQTHEEGYSVARDNIGNLKATSYLEAMSQVYHQCYKVLKPNGLMILITKDFIRKKQRVFLSVDTLKLCEKAGFVLEDWHERKLTRQSFWRILYSRKHPEVEKLETEDVLVFKRKAE